MIEALIGMLLLSLWMLATAGLLLSMFKYQKGAGNRYVAVALASELAELMDANGPAARAGNYALASTSSALTQTHDCATNFCNAAELADHDLATWVERVRLGVPLQEVKVEQESFSSPALVRYRITISWTEPRGAQTYATTGTTETLSHVQTKVIGDAAI